MGRKLKDVEIKLAEISWKDARFSHPRITEFGWGIAESGVKLLLIERNRHPYIITGKYVINGGLSKWVTPGFDLIDDKIERDTFFYIEDDQTKIIGWAELPEPTYYLNNQRR